MTRLPARLFLLLTLGLSLATQFGTARALTPLVPANSLWKYEDSGTDLLTAWRDTTYDDSAWPAGSAILGYGESYINTVVSYGGNSSDKNRTTYFRVSTPGKVRLTVHDPRGRLVRTLVDGVLSAGREASAGVYFAVLTANGELRTRKLIRID